MSSTNRAAGGKEQAIFKATGSDFSENDALQCVEAINQSGGESVLVLDLSVVTNVQPKAWRALSLKAAELARQKRRIILLSGHALSKLVTEKGLDNLFECVERHLDNRSYVSNVGIKEVVLHVMNALLGGVVHSLGMAQGQAVSIGKPYLKSSRPPHAFEVGAFSQAQCIPFRGAVCLQFPLETLTAIERGATHTAPRDWICECLSAAFGQVKIQLNEKGFDFSNEIPTIISSAPPSAASVLGTTITIPLSCPAGPFYLEITTNPQPMS